MSRWSALGAGGRLAWLGTHVLVRRLSASILHRDEPDLLVQRVWSGSGISDGRWHGSDSH